MSPAHSDHFPATSDHSHTASNAMIAWFRGEFAASNAIIDTLCHHLSQLENGKRDYEHVFKALHRRRINWIPVIQMQKFFSVADVTVELQKVIEEKMMTSDAKGVEKKKKIEEIVVGECNGIESPKSEITESGSEEMQPLVESVKTCSSQEDCEAWRAQIKMTKGFIAKESYKGHMTNVVRGLKLYEKILTDPELTQLNDYVNKLRVAGKNGELSGETFIMYNQQSKAIKRELIQFGTPIFGQIKDEATRKSQDSNIEPIPAPLEAIIDHLIKYHLISEAKRPNSCIINFFDEGEFSQPFLKPPHLEHPVSTLVLSESTMAFGRTLVCDKDGNYKGPLMLSLNEGSLLVMRGNSADVARHVMCQSPSKRVSVTFFKVQKDTDEKNLSATGPITVWQPSVPTPHATGPVTVWRPSVPTPHPQPIGPVNGYGSMGVVSKWGVIGAPQLLMLAPLRPMVMSPRRLPRGGTGVFLPRIGSRKPVKHLPPRAQRERLLTLPVPAEPHKMGPKSGSGNI